MVCPIKTETEYGYNADSGSCYYSGNSSFTSNSSVPAHFQKRGMPFFSGVITVFVTIWRYYTPENGRWISRDPIQEKGGWNLYAMVSNNVVAKWDYLGKLFTPGGQGYPENPFTNYPGMDSEEYEEDYDFLKIIDNINNNLVNDKLKEGFTALFILMDTYARLQDDPQYSDKYFHCIGACEAKRATSRSDAFIWLNVKEAYDIFVSFADLHKPEWFRRYLESKNITSSTPFMETIGDSIGDMIANFVGLNCPIEKSCEECCCCYKKGQ